MKIVVLGHNGLLGNAVYKFFKFLNFEVITLKERWPSNDFKEKLITTSASYVVNCIGSIPQKKEPELYESLNFELPLWLDRNVPIRIIHPTTDCEFKGSSSPNYRYGIRNKRDAHDHYGISKAKLSEALEHLSLRTKLIRTSIIGIETTTSVSLLSWFLAQNQSVNGFVNHYWNGITTLEWSKQCLQLMMEWNARPFLNQVGTAKIHSKYEMLLLFKKVFNKSVDVYPKETETINKALFPEILTKDLFLQLEELKNFYELIIPQKDEI